MSDTSKASASEATAKVFIARQDTLEAVRDTLEAVRDTLEAVQGNTDGEILPAVWIAEYKLHGENSYVFRDADVLARMYKSTAAVNDPQINGEALEFVLTHPGAASLSDWLMRLSDTRAEGQALFAGIETAEQLAGNAGAMAAVVQSEILFPALLNNETILAAFGMSETAMNVICADKTVFEKAIGFNKFKRIMREKDMPAAKLIAALAGIAFETITGLAGIVSNAESMQEVALSLEAMTFTAESPVAMDEIVADADALECIKASEYYSETIGVKDMPVAKILASVAGIETNTVSGMADITENADVMELFANSKSLLAAAAENLVSVVAIENSQAAISKLEESSLIKTQVYTIENAFISRRPGKIFLLGQMQNAYGSGGSASVAYTIRGNTSVGSQISDMYNKYAPINRFMKNLFNYTTTTSALSVYYKFIPID